MEISKLPSPEEGLEDNIPIVWKMFVDSDDDELTDKVTEEYKEFYAMDLLAKHEMENEGLDDKTKEMLAKEIVDLIFAANTKLASLYIDKADRDKLFSDTYRKNYARGYYDLPKNDSRNIPDGVLKGYNKKCEDVATDYESNKRPSYYRSDNGIDVIDISEMFGLDEDAYLFNCLKYIIRAGKKDGNSEVSDINKAINYLQRKRKKILKGVHE